ncbi:hypothetical protein [uncultured Eubacterium sp.]|uniref:PTS sugar transporter subunit IIA n=1 Tax=uncultured Eubacterium sp. TaxID=165185 RepID=UPI00326464DE
MVRYIFASHYRMADGLKETVEFLTSVKENLYTISAYVTEDYNIEGEIKKIFDGFSKEDKVIVMTDVLAGSVNQKFIPYMGENVFLITGINAPLAMELVLLPEECINKEQLSKSIEMAKETIQFVNEINADTDEDDE